MSISDFPPALAAIFALALAFACYVGWVMGWTLCRGARWQRGTSQLVSIGMGAAFLFFAVAMGVLAILYAGAALAPFVNPR